MLNPFAPAPIPDLAPELLAALRAIHPTSDVGRLWRLPIEDLRTLLSQVRDCYHQGVALRPHAHLTERAALVAEILELRARYVALRPIVRQRLRVGRHGHPDEKEPILC
jgi:hypothetical protein